MRIAFIARSTLYTTPGGDTKQIDMTAAYLRKRGITVTIFKTNEPIDYSLFDLLHFFNIIRPADILYHIHKSGKPYVVSTIFLDYGSFEKKARKGLMKWINYFFSEDRIEYLKAIARWVVNGEKIMSKEYLWKGHRNCIISVAKGAAFLLPNSENEYRRFVNKYQIERPYFVVPNGIEPAIAAATSKQNERYTNAVLCVARIEGRKNQLNLIRALNNTKFNVFIHGKPSPNNLNYFEQCKKEAASNIHFSSWLSEEEMYEMYHSAKVHILPSYFETTGLSSLEAAVMGCNIVVTDRGDTKDYFDGYAWFCDPDDPASIKAAVSSAFEAPFNEEFKTKILDSYTWAKAAEVTHLSYQKVLTN